MLPHHRATHGCGRELHRGGAALCMCASHGSYVRVHAASSTVRDDAQGARTAGLCVYSYIHV